MGELPILLTGYAAKQCARRVHNEWDPTVEVEAWDPPPELAMRLAAGIAFESEVFAAIREILGPDRCLDLSDVRGRSHAIESTVAAMDAGVEVILGGWLPDDFEGGRAGRPDILVRHSVEAGDAHYLAGDVKGHKTTALRSRGMLRFSRMAAPQVILEQPGYAPQITSRLDDFLQLAHYWRMLQACGRTPPGVDPTGFIIGTDTLSDLDPLAPVLVWHDLTAPRFETYSRSRGKTKRTALERYDHEHGFRMQIAQVAASRTGALTDPAPLVEPIFSEECDSCPWFDYCLDVTGVDTASARIKAGRLSIREWKALAALGVSTIDDLAGLDVNDPTFQDRYLPEVTHVKDPIDRVSVAVRRAGMLSEGVVLERTTVGPIVVPRADVEVDFDIEWDTDDRVYLWGALVRRGDEPPSYMSTVSWDQLDQPSERELASRFVRWLRDLIQKSTEQGQSLLVYHYSHPEPGYLTRLLGEYEVADLLAHFVDLLPIIRDNFFGLEGLGIKKVAPAFGFTWRDEDPGGLQSQLWLQEARNPSDEQAADAARKRILNYNEDDVRATLAIRNELNHMPMGPPRH